MNKGSKKIVNYCSNKKLKWYKRFGIKEVLKSNFKNGAIYYLWGYPYQLIIKNDVSYNIAIENNNLIFYTPSPDSVEMNRTKLLLWYDKLLEIEIDKIKDRIEKIVGQKADRYSVSNGSGYHGRCYIEYRKIEIHRKVVFFRKEILEYVMTHELIHFIVPDHPPDFYKLQNKYYPNNETARWCLAWKNPDYRYYNYVNEQTNKIGQGFIYTMEEYCDLYNIKKEIL